MLEAFQPTPEPGWVLSHDGYSVLTESAVEVPLRLRQRLSRDAGGPLGQSWPDLDELARLYPLGLLAPLLSRRLIRHAQHRAARAGARAHRRLVARANPAGRRAAARAPRRGPGGHARARHAPRCPALVLDASHPRRYHRDGRMTCACSRSPIVPRDCNCSGSPSTGTVSKCASRPRSGWPGSAWSLCGLRRISAPGAPREPANPWR